MGCDPVSPKPESSSCLASARGVASANCCCLATATGVAKTAVGSCLSTPNLLNAHARLGYPWAADIAACQSDVLETGLRLHWAMGECSGEGCSKAGLGDGSWEVGCRSWELAVGGWACLASAADMWALSVERGCVGLLTGVPAASTVYAAPAALVMLAVFAASAVFVAPAASAVPPASAVLAMPAASAGCNGCRVIVTGVKCSATQRWSG